MALAFLFALLRENPAIRERRTLHPLTALQYQNHKTKSTLRYDFDSSCLRLGFPSFCATATLCACKEAEYIHKRRYCKAVKTAWSPRHPFRPCGKTCTASFRSDAWQNAILPRFTDNRRMKVFCDKIIVKREVAAQNTLRLRDAITKQYSFVEKAPFRRFQTSAP